MGTPAKSPAPLDHAGVVVRVRDRNGPDASRADTASTTARSSSEMQSQRTLPSAVRTNNARCPMAKCGSMPMPSKPGSSNLIAWRWLRRKLVQGRPVLPRRFDVLTAVFADRANSRRLVALGVLRPASGANEVGHRGYFPGIVSSDHAQKESSPALADLSNGRANLF